MLRPLMHWIFCPRSRSWTSGELAQQLLRTWHTWESPRSRASTLQQQQHMRRRAAARAARPEQPASADSSSRQLALHLAASMPALSDSSWQS